MDQSRHQSKLGQIIAGVILCALLAFAGYSIAMKQAAPMSRVNPAVRQDRGLLIRVGEAAYMVGGDRNLKDARECFELALEQSDQRDAYWWHAQLRLLQIREKAGEDHQHLRAVLTELSRLDPNLGGPRFKALFDQLAARL